MLGEVGVPLTPDGLQALAAVCGFGVGVLVCHAINGIIRDRLQAEIDHLRTLPPSKFQTVESNTR